MPSGVPSPAPASRPRPRPRQLEVERRRSSQLREELKKSKEHSLAVVRDAPGAAPARARRAAPVLSYRPRD